MNSSAPSIPYMLNMVSTHTQHTVLGLKCAMISTLVWLHVSKCN